MKKLLALFMIVILCASLCACGSNKIDLSQSDVESAYENSEGSLNIDASKDKVKSYTFTLEDANTDDLIDREYCDTALNKILNGSTGDTTLGELQVGKVIMAVTETVNFLSEDTDEEFDVDAFIDELLDITCDGIVYEYSGWSVHVEVDDTNNTATIVVE